MSDLADLYQDIILDHGKRPRNLRCLEHADRAAEGFNPLCGDRVTVQMTIDGGSIGDIAFTGSGCAICMASASMMTEHLRGRTESDARRVFAAFREMLTTETSRTEGVANRTNHELGKLEALAGVRRFPMRVKCATLPWHTMRAALDGAAAEPVSTE